MFFYAEIDASRTRPDAGQALRLSQRDGYYHVRGVRQGLSLSLRARNAYPTTYCRQAADGSISAGYGNTQGTMVDEYLRIQLTPQGNLRLERDLCCTLPLFYGLSEGVFVISNDFHEVCTRLPRLTPSDSGISHELYHADLELLTIFKEVGILGERQVLSYKDGKLAIHNPPPRPWTYNASLAPTNPHDFPDVLQERFDYFIQTRLSGERFGMEISCGLDSSLLPLYMHSRDYGGPLIGGTLTLPDHEERQRQKIAVLQTATGLQDHLVPMSYSQDYPLRAFLDVTQPRFFHVMCDLYAASVSRMIDAFLAQGITVVASGQGGDELAEHHPDPAQRPDKQDFTPPRPLFAGPRTQLPPGYSTRQRTIPTLLSYEVALMNVVHANTYIERGIWPVSPFFDPVLYDFCQALPIQHRTNKNFMRAYYQAAHFPSEIYLGASEDFESFAITCLTSDMYADIVNYFTENAVTERLGYVDARKIRESLAAQRLRPVPGELMDIVTWLCIEANVRLITDKNTNK